MDEIRNKYHVHKAGAKRRNIPFLFTFEQWWDIWQKSGHWAERGWGADKYCMSRIGDVGPYEVSNVFVQTNGENVRQAQLGTHNPRGPMSAEHKKNLSIARTGIKISVPSKLKGKPQSEEHKQKNREAQLRNSKLLKEIIR